MSIEYVYLVPLAGSIVLGIVTALLGVFSFFRQQSLLGDAIAHATLPGVTGMFLLTHTRNPLVLLLGGMLSGSFGAVCIEVIARYTTLKREAIIGIVLSVFFGIGLVCITIIQKLPIGNQAILHAFLIGNASTMLLRDVITISCVGLVVLLIVYACYKELLLCTFDRLTARTMGYPVYIIDTLFTLLLVAIISIGLPIMGVVLMSVLFIAPVAAAWQWTQRMGKLFFLAACIGGMAAGFGVYISSCGQHVPSGPVIVLLLCFTVMFSLVCAPYVKKMCYTKARK